MQGMQTQGYDLEVMEQASSVLTSSNSAVMLQLEDMNETMNAMQGQLRTLAYAKTNQARSKGKHYFWSRGRNYTHGRKT